MDTLQDFTTSKLIVIPQEEIILNGNSYTQTVEEKVLVIESDWNDLGVVEFNFNIPSQDYRLVLFPEIDKELVVEIASYEQSTMTIDSPNQWLSLLNDGYPMEIENMHISCVLYNEFKDGYAPNYLDIYLKYYGETIGVEDDHMQ